MSEGERLFEKPDYISQVSWDAACDAWEKTGCNIWDIANAIEMALSISQARLSEAVKVLEPFAREADVWEYYPDDEELGTMTVADLRAAKAFLATIGEENE